MPPVIIAAAVGVAASAAAAAGVIAVSTALVISIAATAAATLLTKVPSVGAIGSYTSQAERQQTLRSSTAPQTHIYGSTVVSGTLFFAEEQSGDQTDGEWLHLAITLAGHPIHGIGRIWLGDDDVSAYSGYVTYELHNNRQEADPFMLANCSSWKSDMIGKGIAWLRMSLKYNQDKFPSGLPTIKVEVFGKEVYDPRNGTTYFTDNAALCILDFYRSFLKVPDSQLNMNQFIQAASICDEVLVNSDGSSRKRYAINGPFDATEAQASVLDDMHKSCAGNPTYMGGLHGILVGAYYGPATLTINPGQIVSDVKIVPEPSYSDKVNTVTGTFLDAKNLYVETEYPTVQIAQYVDEDDAEFTSDLKLRFVSNEFQAQQLAQILINQKRIGGSITFTMNLSGYMYRPGYYVILNLPQLGINGVEYRITEWSLNADSGIDVILKRETAAVWQDAIGNTIDRPDITDFPTATVPQPINLYYAVEEIGQVVQGILSWTNVGQVMYNVVTVRQGNTVVYTVQVPGESVRLTGLPRGTYQIGVIAVTLLGRSVEAFTEIVIQAPDKPSSVEIGQGYFSIVLKPKLAQLANVSTQFDFWTSGETKLTSAATNIVEANATRAGLGTIWTAENLKVGQTYWWYIRSINAFGTSDFLEVEALCDSDFAGLIDIVDEAFKTSSAYTDLKKPIDTNIEAIMQAFVAQGAEVKYRYQQSGQLKAEILQVSSTVATVEQATAQLQTNLQALSDSTTASLQEKLTATVHADGSAATSWIMDMQVIKNAVAYKAGIGLSLDPVGNSYKSTFLVQASQFGVYSGSDASSYKLVFAVYNGQVVIDDALIRNASITTAKIADASITNAKISGDIYSANWASGNSGWLIARGGYAEFNNVVIRGTVIATQGRFSFAGTDNVVILDNNGLTINIPGGGLIRLGRW